ncbi:MAG: tautomerase family protein [Chloroflexota bacterium]
MPLVQVALIDDVFSDEEKRQVIEQFTETLVRIKGEKIRRMTWVVLTEEPRAHWGMGADGPDELPAPYRAAAD